MQQRQQQQQQQQQQGMQMNQVQHGQQHMVNAMAGQQQQQQQYRPQPNMMVSEDFISILSYSNHFNRRIWLFTAAAAGSAAAEHATKPDEQAHGPAGSDGRAERHD